MTAYLIIRATDGNCGMLKGHITAVRDTPYTGSGYVLPNFLKVTVTGATAAQIREYLEPWETRYKHDAVDGQTVWQITITVDPDVISASGYNNPPMKTKFRDWAEDEWGLTVVDFTTNAVVVNAPKATFPLITDLVPLKLDFADKFNEFFSKRQFYFRDAFVSAVVAAGGTATVTKAQAQSNIRNKLDD